MAGLAKSLCVEDYRTSSQRTHLLVAGFNFSSLVVWRQAACRISGELFGSPLFYAVTSAVSECACALFLRVYTHFYAFYLLLAHACAKISNINKNAFKRTE